MLAMQYNFSLPADYDMSIIDKRIREKGHLIDNFPNLRLKAYFWSTRDAAKGVGENSYCPFYLWDRPQGLNDFICGPGFVGLTQSFGWPSVRTWSVWGASIGEDVKSARYATRSIDAIAPYEDMAALRQRTLDDLSTDSAAPGAVAAIAAFEPTHWSVVRVCLWSERPDGEWVEGRSLFDVGYVSHSASGEV